jgi:hypothetical protein
MELPWSVLLLNTIWSSAPQLGGGGANVETDRLSTAELLWLRFKAVKSAQFQSEIALVMRNT